MNMACRNAYRLKQSEQVYEWRKIHIKCYHRTSYHAPELLVPRLQWASWDWSKNHRESTCHPATQIMQSLFINIERNDVLVWLSVWSEVQIVCIWSSWCDCRPKTPRSPASFKSRLVLPLCYWPLNGCSIALAVPEGSTLTLGNILITL